MPPRAHPPAAMTALSAAGQRHILSDREMSLHQMALAIRDGLNRPGLRVPGFELPSWLVRIVGLFDRQIRDNVAELDNVRAVNGDRGRQLIGRLTIPASEAIVATAESLFEYGLVKA